MMPLQTARRVPRSLQARILMSRALFSLSLIPLTGYPLDSRNHKM